MESSKTNLNLIVVGQKICILAEIGCHWDKQSNYFPYVIIMIKLESSIFFLDYFQYEKLSNRLNYDTQQQEEN
jgi:hypothetical protein